MPRTGCYETFWAIGAAGLLDLSELQGLKSIHIKRLLTDSSFNDIVSTS
jgi:hypothetical protein